MKFFNWITRLLLLTLTSVLAAYEQEPQEDETGEDETSRVSRFDVRYIYQDRANNDEHRITLRSDKSFSLDTGWTLGTRVDLPMRYNDRFNAMSNPNSDWEAGIGDVLLQGVLTRQRRTRFPWGTYIPPFPWNTKMWTEPRFRIGAGMRTVLPTATGDQFGTGKWQLGVLAALTYDMPEISQGSYVGLTVRNQFDIAGDRDRNDINQLVITPRMRVNLGSRWAFITAPNITINLENDNKLFVPISGQISYRNDSAVYSLEVEQAIIDDFALFDTQIEFRVGFFY